LLTRCREHRRAFHEDLAIIEAQQKVFDADPNYQLLAIGADAALTYFRWLLARRIEAEGSAARAA
jgi:vanillate O-demethylase monooxygenase subunit